MWYDSFLYIVNQSFSSFGVYLPRIFAALLILIIGAALARVLKKILIKIFESVRLSSALKDTPVDLFLKNAELTTKIEEVIGSIAYWLLMLVVIYTTVSVLGLVSLSVLLARLLSYLPKVISAVIILFIGLLLAGLVESLVKGSIRTIDGKSGRLLGKFASYLVVVLSSMIAISELGIAKEFILVLFVGFVSFLALGMGLALGLGGQHMVKKMLDDWYGKFKKETAE
ncbi:MAG: hypothetical protein COY81_03805 [Candidatus Pacebacteria bacterium CG_4_10_14_0_8_um_filter_43_12]|nr:MAG: hypothetical protein COU66_00750 [Candidatus Pacebacteria bacterium CG10_big_fil_rev_8_21_14_0_10_44_11]PIY79209.1 MAG: hypothetical protein COY81_03805 [Candidatus Pacebacteria bacterium CG_4_10_14_0_8_um_filter_43_12]